MAAGTRYAGSVCGQVCIPKELQAKYARLRASMGAHPLGKLLGGIGAATLMKLDRGGVAHPDSVKKIVEALSRIA
jgi:hypothetical protein